MWSLIIRWKQTQKYMVAVVSVSQRRRGTHITNFTSPTRRCGYLSRLTYQIINPIIPIIPNILPDSSLVDVVFYRGLTFQLDQACCAVTSSPTCFHRRLDSPMSTRRCLHPEPLNCLLQLANANARTPSSACPCTRAHPHRHARMCRQS
jgi:hypothetical protein